jgi:hypothetical protein
MKNKEEFRLNYYWSTDDSHSDNQETMADYLENHMPDDWKIEMEDGTYAEIATVDGERYEVHASGNGDSNNHKIEFKLIEED